MKQAESFLSKMAEARSVTDYMPAKIWEYFYIPDVLSWRYHSYLNMKFIYYSYTSFFVNLQRNEI